ncbi:hypothetical protein FSARC_11325 [Fusarium sarcochroum]|uniref:Rhodopsin domain-containing protein n=1 Tax=Fusarium sarcochroum TaxID=1208366 RepID=A0A8H4X087_9HYPO|nr:hypothetical protein FSARC_11325 [Fusarium sarcochroum]
MTVIERSNLYADRREELTTATTVVLVLAAVFVVLRFWARYVRVGFGADDWMTIAALVFVFITGGLNYGMIAHGLGKHAKVVSTQDQITFFKLLLAFENIYVTAVMLIKLALLKIYYMDTRYSLHLVCRRGGLRNHRPLSTDPETTHAQDLVKIRKLVP